MPQAGEPGSLHGVKGVSALLEKPYRQTLLFVGRLRFLGSLQHVRENCTIYLYAEIGVLHAISNISNV